MPVKLQRHMLVLLLAEEGQLSNNMPIKLTQRHPDVNVTLSPFRCPKAFSVYGQVSLSFSAQPVGLSILFYRTIWYLVLDSLIRPIKSFKLGCCPFDF